MLPYLCFHLNSQVKMELTKTYHCLVQFLPIFCVLLAFQTSVSDARRKYGCVVPRTPKFGGFLFDDKSKSLKLLCIKGYVQTGDKERTCVNHEWTGQEADCVNVETTTWKYGCPLPKVPLLASFTFNDNSKSMTLHCAPTFYQAGDAERICRNGKWSGKEGDCIDLNILDNQCPELKDPQNGRVIVESRHEGGMAHFFCEEGYALEGSPEVTCHAGRMWDGILPVCSSRKTVDDFARHLKETMIDSLAGATVNSETGAQSRLSPGKSGLDIVLLVDVSSSIGKKSLESAKKFMKKLVDIFGVSDQPSGGKNGTRFALLTFSDKATVVFNVDDKGARSVQAVKQKIDEIQNTGGGTNFREALKDVAVKVHGMKVSLDINRLQDATRAIFIITDAQETTTLNADRLGEIKMIADPLKTEQHFEIFSIGVGQNIDKFMLAEIASKPEVGHVFLINQFQDLERIGDIIAEKNIDYGQCGISGRTEISQGTQSAVKGAWPWLGWLIATGNDASPVTCGGALICDRWFLTAASCVSTVQQNGTIVPRDPRNVNVYLSDHDIFENDNDEVHAIVYDILIHDNYTGEEIDDLGVRINDIALLDLGENETTRPVLNKFLRPICFPVNTTWVASDAAFKILQSFPETNSGYTAGWGHGPDNAKSAYSKYPFDKLQQNERPLQKNDICQKRYPKLDLNRFFCVGKEIKEIDSCVGDIGGPYMVQMANKHYVNLGIALNTTKCDQMYQFSIFMSTVHQDINDWMEPILDGCNRVDDLYTPAAKKN